MIRFWNPDFFGTEFLSEIVSYTNNSITVKTKDSSWWDIVNSNVNTKISSGWKFRIFCTNYGYTDSITYKDFYSASTSVTATIDKTDTEISLSSTSDLSVGDRIIIVSESKVSKEVNISQINSTTLITVDESLGQMFYLNKNPYLKVLSNDFTNTHTHQVRRRQLQPIVVSDYLERGYESTHAHIVIPFVKNISDIIIRNGEIVIGGSSSKLYLSYNNGDGWTDMVDLNFVGEGNNIESVTSLYSSDGRIFAGTQSGYIYVEYINNKLRVKLEIPEVS